MPSPFNFAASLTDYICDDLWNAFSIDDPRMENLILTTNYHIATDLPSYTTIPDVEGQGSAITVLLYNALLAEGAFVELSANERILIYCAFIAHVCCRKRCKKSILAPQYEYFRSVVINT